MSEENVGLVLNQWNKISQNKDLDKKQKEKNAFEVFQKYYLDLNNIDIETKAENSRYLLTILTENFSDKKIELPESLEKIEHKFRNYYSRYWSLLGLLDYYNRKSIQILEFQSWLVQKGFYTDKMSEYDLEVILNFKHPSQKSYYLSNYCSLKDENIESIQKHIINKIQKNGVLPESVEQVGHKIKYDYSRYWFLLGILDYFSDMKSLKDIKISKFQNWLIQKGFYTDKMSEYDSEVILNLEKNQTSYYLSDYCSLKEYNIETIQKYIIDKIKKTGILPESLEVIDQDIKNNYSRYWVLLGIFNEFTKRHIDSIQVLEFKSWLVQKGFYSDEISSYDLEEIFKLDKLNDLYFLSDKCSSKNENQRKILKLVRRKITNEKILPQSLEEIDKYFINDYSKYWILLGILDYYNRKDISKIQIPEIQSWLVQKGFYSDEISEYDLGVILNFKTNQISYYLSDKCSLKDENIKKIKTFQTFRNFVFNQKLPDSSTVSNKKIINFLEKYKIIPKTLKKVNSGFLKAKWTKELENRLIKMYNEDQNLIDKLYTTDLADKEFGRSPKAVISKLYELIGVNSNQGTYKNSHHKKVKHFPTNEKFLNVLKSLVEYSQIPIDVFSNIFEDMEYFMFPVLKYTYPFGRQTEEEEYYFVFLLPIEFKGFNLKDYNEYEQILISNMQNKLINLENEEIACKNVNIFEAQTSIRNEEKKDFLFRPNYSLVGLYIKKKFSLNESFKNKHQKFSILLEDNSKINFDICFFSEDE